MDIATTKERPILFSGPMVRAILDGRKTQTRRVVKKVEATDELRNEHDQNDTPLFIHSRDRRILGELTCPYGKPGDRLWVREDHFRFGHWARVPDATTRTGRSKWQFVGDSDEVLFEQPRELCRSMNAPYFDRPGWYKRVARYMPRWASRIDLELTGVRVERLQEISEADAKAEGVDEMCVLPGDQGSFAQSFSYLWESINGPDSWAANPWVWVVEFRRIGGAK